MSNVVNTSEPSPAPIRVRLTGGQRASAILGGIIGHTIFAVGWFGFGFILVGALFSAVINALLRSALGPIESDALMDFLDRAGAIVWIVILVFTVGAIAFMALGIMVSGSILRRGEVHRPWGTTWGAVVVAAIIDIPAFWIAIWVSTAVADTGTGMVVLPPVFALILVIAIGGLVWWWIAHVNRAKAAPALEGTTGSVPPSVTDAGDHPGEPAKPLEQSAGSLGEQVTGLDGER